MSWGSTDRMVLPLDMVDNSISPLQTHFGPVFSSVRQSRQAFSSQSEAPSECFCWHLHPSPRDMTLHPPLALVPLKRKPAAMGKRAPRAPSIVGWFSLLPSLGYAVGSVAPDVCPLVLEAARALPAAIREDAQNGSTRATTPDGPTGMGTAEPSPRCDVPAPLLHGGRSNSPAQ